MPVWSAVRMRGGRLVVLMIVIVIESSVQRSTLNVQLPIQNNTSSRVALATRDLAFALWVTLISVVRCADVVRSFTVFAAQDDSAYPTAAMTFNSIAIGVGNAPTSIVVRVGFGLVSPEKYCA